MEYSKIAPTPSVNSNSSKNPYFIKKQNSKKEKQETSNVKNDEAEIEEHLIAELAKTENTEKIDISQAIEKYKNNE